MVLFALCLFILYGDFSKLAEMGWDAIFNFAMENQQGGEPYISALSVTVDPQYRGCQIPALLINALKHAAKEYAAKAVIVPVRPTLKHCYPLQDFEAYCGWQNERGSLLTRGSERIGGWVPRYYSPFIVQWSL